MMPNDSRGLDHLMEQNETELDFLSAYGGVDDGQQGDAYALFSAVHRFLVAGGVDCSVVEETLTFSNGTVRVEDAKCWLTFTGTHLPLVLSDLQMPGFVDGLLADDRSMVTVHITQWSHDQRRFIERLVEHRSRA